MKAETLRKSILQYAIQGKLVPQIDTEEPASELLKKIKAEKNELIQQGKIKNEIPLSQICDEDKKFSIPHNWIWEKLGNLGDWGAGATPLRAKNEYYANGSILWAKTGELNNSYIYDTTEKITELAMKNCSLRLNKIGDILIAMYGATIGKVAIVGKPLTTNQACCACTPFSGLYNIFLFYLLKALKEDFINQGDGGAQPNISRTKIRNMVVPLPPLKEQQRIVFRIEELMLLVDEYEKKQIELEKLEKDFPEKLKKSVLQYAIQGKLVPQIDTEEPASELLKKIKAEKDELIQQKKIKEPKPLPPITEDEKPFEIPDSWEWVRLGDVSNNIHYGYNASAQEKGNSKLLRITDIQDNKVNWGDVPYCDVTQKEFNSYGLKNRDIMIARTGGTIGKTYIVENLKEQSVFASYLIRVIPPEILFELYLKKFFESPLYWTQLKEKSIGTGQPNVNGTALKELILPLPPLEEQKRIIARVEELFKLVDLLSSGGKK